MAQIQFRSDDTSLWEEKFGDGSDGALTISSNTTHDPTDTICSGTSGSTTLVVSDSTGFAVGDLVLIHQTRNGTATPGTWQLNKINNISGVTWTMKYALVDTFDTTSQVIQMKEYSSVTVNSSVTWTAKAWDGTNGGILPIFCNGTVTVTGSISANGSAGSRHSSGDGVGGTTGGGFRNGLADATDPNSSNTTGEGTSGNRVTIQSSANGNGGGAGLSGAAGGGGGNGTAGSSASGFGTLGAGGSSVGNAGLTVLNLGGGGGGGHWPGDACSGGTGGGAIMIFGKTITVTGSITANGGAGGSASTSSGSPGGGGAGGSILLKGQTITLGSSLVTASAGAAGSGTSRLAGAGGVGRIHADYLTSVSGTTSPSIDSRQDTALTLTSGGSGGAALFFSMI